MSLQAASLREQLARLRPRRLLPLLLVALGCTLVLSLLGFGRLHAQFGELAMRDAQVYKAQIDRFDALLAMVLDAETGVRGYLLNDHKPVYLDAYTESQRAIEPLLARIEADYPPGSADRPEFETLARLVRLKLALLADTVTAGRVISAGPPGQGGAGKAYMDQIRQSIKVLRDHLEARNQTLVNESIKRFREMEHAVTGLALGALGLIIALFGVQQRQATLRARLATLLERENVALESMVSQRTRELSDLASYLTDAREAERARLARELHDELGALLTAAKMDASWLLRSLGATAGPDIQARFRRLIDTIGSGITIKRRIIDDLRPPLLQGLGLVEALRALTDELRGELLEHPERFGELALRHSECPTAMERGRIGYVVAGQLYPELDSALFALRLGELSEVVESPMGLHLLQCLDIQEAEPMPMEQALPLIIERHLQQTRQQQQRLWLKRLQRRAQDVAVTATDPQTTDPCH